MINITNKKDCCGCNACYNICPKSCIEMKEDFEGFLYPTVNYKNCIKCGLCIKVCPMINLKEPKNILFVYGCKSKNIEEKFKSSSGGMFSILANYTLDKGGVVFGAAFNTDFKVEHIIVEDREELDKIRRSKYVQSNINDCYKLAKKHLEEGRDVLFSGTPCQIAGLKNFLNSDYEKLLLVDVVCHGVPSPGIFREYLEYLKNKNNSNIRTINFRAKELSVQAISIEFNSGYKYLNEPFKDIYYKAFLTNLILRPSCYDCRHNNFRSGSDITLGDYWGASNRFPEYQDKENGVSLVIIKTPTGQKLFNTLINKFEYIETDIEHAIIGNPTIVRSSPINNKRDAFFEEYKGKNTEIDKLLLKYTKVSLFRRIVSKLKREINKIV
ncbi:MAG: Coenzyme F420 hydrogenase/dehydrogenase, beta subunit C-terminal domain [Firmicutes bacterium]|nr:Coenzyme F420 hydrogenase/dehydrogenase, beta subunit C-terminal domain [Bacillota bacterium]